MSGPEAILGIAAGSAGLLSLSIQLGDSALKLRRMYQRAKDAPRNISNIVFELETIAMILREIENQRQQSGYFSPLIHRCISQCQKSVVEIQELIDKIDRHLISHGRLGSNIYSALKESEMLGYLGKLERVKSSLELAYMMYLGDDQRRLFQINERILAQQDSIFQDIRKQLVFKDNRSHLSTQESSQGEDVLLEPGINVDDSDLMAICRSRKDGSGNLNTYSHRIHHSHCSTRRAKSRKIHQVRVQLPNFISNMIWDFAVTRSQSCYHMYLQMYNTVPANAIIFYYCENGDLEMVRATFQKKEASPLDIILLENGPYTLLEAAAQGGHVELCRYLLRETTGPDSSRVLSRALDSFSDRNRSDELNRAMYHLFMGHSDFDLDLDQTTRHIWLQHCTDSECLSSILDMALTCFGAHPVEARFELASRLVYAKPTWFLSWTGLKPSDPKLAIMKNSCGTSMMHWIASSLGNCLPFNQPLSDSATQLLELGVKVLRNGANPCSVADANDMSFFYYQPFMNSGAVLASFVSKDPSPCKTTPLLLYLGIRDWRLHNNPIEWQKHTLYQILVWTQMIIDAGIDLCAYGTMERETWSRLDINRKLEVSGYTEISDLVFGPRPTDWSLKTFFVRSQSLYRLESPPGAFPEDQRLPLLIAWRPTSSESSEGYWSLKKEKVLPSKTMDIRELLSIVTGSENTLVDAAQDDSGVIMLMQYRASRRRYPLKRSHSQPPMLQRRDISYYASHTSRTRHWLMSYHFCPFDSHWRLNCNYDASSVGNSSSQVELYDKYMNLSDHSRWKVCNVRACVKGEIRYLSSVQESHRWQQYSFLAGIAACQDHYPRQPSTLVRNSYYHSGTQDCPRGCAKVHLHQLAVPTSLRYFHPISRFKGNNDLKNGS